METPTDLIPPGDTDRQKHNKKADTTSKAVNMKISKGNPKSTTMSHKKPKQYL